MANIGPFFLILGFIILAGTAGLFLSPRIASKIQTARYAKVENEHYLAGISDDDHYTAQTAKSSYVRSKDKSKLRSIHASDKDIDDSIRRAEEAKKNRSGRFLSALHENRARREMAREAGITMEQFKEMEKEYKQKEKSKEHNLSDIRKALEDKKPEDEVIITQETEEAAKVKNNDGPEFDTLESVKQDALFRENEFTQAAKPTTAPRSILSGIRRLSGEEPEPYDFSTPPPPNSVPKNTSEYEPPKEQDYEPPKSNREYEAPKQQDYNVPKPQSDAPETKDFVIPDKPEASAPVRKDVSPPESNDGKPEASTEKKGGSILGRLKNLTGEGNS